MVTFIGAITLLKLLGKFLTVFCQQLGNHKEEPDLSCTYGGQMKLPIPGDCLKQSKMNNL